MRMRCVVLGGGIAGSCCAQELLRQGLPVVLVSASALIKVVQDVTPLTRSGAVQDFKVAETDASSMQHPGLTVVRGRVVSIDIAAKEVAVAPASIDSDASGSAASSTPSAHNTGSLRRVPYDKLCVCLGATPKAFAEHPCIVTIRDTESVEELAARLSGVRRVVVVGNGGIALQLAAELQGLAQQANAGSPGTGPEFGSGSGSGLEVVWVLKHGHIGDAFFDVDAAEFLLQQLHRRQGAEGQEWDGGQRRQQLSEGLQDTGQQLQQQQPHEGQQGQREGGHWQGADGQGGKDHPALAGASGQHGAGSAGCQGQKAAAGHGGRLLGHAAGPQWTLGLREALLARREADGAGGEPPQGSGSSGGQGREARLGFGATARDGQEAGGGAPTASEAETQAAAPVPATHAPAGGEEGGGAGSESSSEPGLKLELSATVVAVSSSGSLGDTGDGGGGRGGREEQHTWPLYLHLSNGKVLGCDLAVSAIGVAPQLPPILSELLPDPTSTSNSVQDPAIAAAPAAAAPAAPAAEGVPARAANPGLGSGADVGAPKLSRCPLALAPDGGLLVDGQMRCVHAAPPEAGDSGLTGSVCPGALGELQKATLGTCGVRPGDFGDEPRTGAAGEAAVARQQEGEVGVASRSLEDVFAAGDACTVEAAAQGPFWFQMRLWTQARSLSIYAAHCMAGVQDDFGSSFALELFAHVTHFFGVKVVLLGLYNGQKLEHEPPEDVVTYSRATDDTFVHVVLLRGRMQGAVLLGETGLEEAFENLILDGLDVSAYGPELLDPDVELDHLFD